MKSPWLGREKRPVLLVAGLGGLVTTINLVCAQGWTAGSMPPVPNLHIWRSIAASADGAKLVAVGSGPGAYGIFLPFPLYFSTDSGLTWQQQAGSPTNLWSSVASSADGTKLVAVAGYPGVCGWQHDQRYVHFRSPQDDQGTPHTSFAS